MITDQIIEHDPFILEMNIEDLDLSPRIKNCLKKMQIVTLQDLLSTDYETIKKARNMGEGSLLELKNYIHGLGFVLKGEEESIDEKRRKLKNKGVTLLEDLGFSSNVYLRLYRNGIYTMED